LRRRPDHWIKMLPAAVAMFVLAICWECLDYAFAGRWIFDSRGYDMTDIVVGLIGCILAILI